MNKGLILHILPLILFFNTIQGCLPSRTFDHAKHPDKPDYADEDSWVALPWRFDAADCIPQNCPTADKQDSAQVDVFYVYPTVYVIGTKWNAKITNTKILTKIGTITESQASAYNVSCKVYTPLYRQAILKAFLNDKSGPKALDLAYSDVKEAFNYYLTHWNNGRPFILAGHSQGSNHLIRLLKEEIDGKEIQDRMIAAYLIGMPVRDHTFSSIPLAQNESQLNAYISWNTFVYGTRLKPTEYFAGGTCINPLTWNTDTTYVPSSLNPGGAPTQLDRIDKNICDAKINNGILWVNKPKKKGYIRLGKSYHLCDYSLFYLAIRNNVQIRTQNYFNKKQSQKLQYE